MPGIRVAVEERFVPISGREYLLAGSLLLLLAPLLGSFSLIATGLGLVVYLLGLYLWNVDVDSRPLKLFAVEVGLFAVALYLLTLSSKWVLLNPSWGFYKLVNSLAPAYPVLVANALVYRVRMGLFAESTDELNFNLAGNVYLIGALLFPILVGVVLMAIARFVEAYSYWKLPMTAKTNVTINFSPKKAIAIFTASLLLSPVLFHVPFESYGHSARSDGVALYWKTSGSLVVVDVLIAVPRDSCGVRVYVDGRAVGQNYDFMVFWGPFQSLLFLPGDAVIRYHLEFGKMPENVTVSVCRTGVEYSQGLNGIEVRTVENWTTVTFELSK
nr:DUF996 domain-containing protein [Thermococcus sp. 21S9]